MKNNKNNSNPLTLKGLAEYNQEVLFPFLKESFILKKEFDDFKNKSLTNDDKLMKKLDILLTEKEMRRHQDEKQKKLLLIMLKALKDHQILSSEQMAEIGKLEYF